MKRWLWLAALAILATGLWWGLRPQRRPAPRPATLTFLLTCDVHTADWCRADVFPASSAGSTRIATLFGPRADDQVRVDAGDALAGGADYERIQYRYIQQAFARLGYDALNIGQREAGLNASQLHELKAHAPVTMLSANLLEKATGAPLFDAYKIVERAAGWRVALVGVLDGRTLGENLGEGLAIEDMNVTLGRLLPTLKNRADWHRAPRLRRRNRHDQGLAQQFYELDVILGGKVRQPSQQLIKENRSFILATTNEARAVEVFSRSTGAVPINSARSWVRVKLVDEKIPQSQEIGALAIAYREEIRGTKLAIDDPATLREDMVPGVQPHNTYAGTQSCAQCHPSAFKAWGRSGHAPGLRHAHRVPGGRRSELHWLPYRRVWHRHRIPARRRGGQSIPECWLRELPRAGRRTRQGPQFRR